jgi:hypothetical protein
MSSTVGIPPAHDGGSKMPFPLTLTMKSTLLDDFRECELGSFEDYEGAEDPEDRTRDLYADEHVYVILGRHLTRDRKTSRVEIRTAGEAAEVYYAACSGTFKLHPAGYREATRIADLLRPLIREEFPALVEAWRRPEPY